MLYNTFLNITFFFITLGCLSFHSLVSIAIWFGFDKAAPVKALKAFIAKSSVDTMLDTVLPAILYVGSFGRCKRSDMSLQLVLATGRANRCIVCTHTAAAWVFRICRWSQLVGFHEASGRHKIWLWRIQNLSKGGPDQEKRGL